MHTYSAIVTYEKKRIGNVECGNGMSIKFSAPPEFGGFGGFATPEDCFVASVSMCFMLTFESICKKMGADFSSFECSCEGILETKDGKEMFTKIVLRPKVTGDTKEKLKKALRLAEEYCLVAKSIRSDVVLEIEDIL